MRQFPNLPSSYSSYHPKDPFTELDVSDTHVNQLYACASCTLNLARLSYWIPAGRQHFQESDQSLRHLQDDYRIAAQHSRHTQAVSFTVTDVDSTRALALYIREAGA